MELATPRIGDSGESFFEYEYLREFEAKIGTARKVVLGTHEEPISAKTPDNPPHCHVPLKRAALAVLAVEMAPPPPPRRSPRISKY
jgi:hypothetical protein